jgi:SnoaL-like domain
MSLNLKDAQQLADQWYAALDQHAPLSDVTQFLIDDGLEMRFPEATAKGHAGFAEWYRAVTNRFFDEKHVITQVAGDVTGDEATITVLVHWEARMWDPPAPNSSWLGFDADQTWVVVLQDGDKAPKIKTYIVNELAPVPGSASL